MKKSGMKGRIITIASVGLVCLMALSVLAPVASAATDPSWNYAFPIGGQRSQAVVVQTDNGVVYVIGGFVGTVSTAVNSVNAYNPSTGTWVALAPLLTATRGAVGGLGADGRIYVVDGTTQRTQIYNITTNVWSDGAVTPTPGGTWEGASAILGDHLYMFGGEDDDSYEIQNWIYNMTTDTWWSGADMLYAAKAGAVVSDDDYAYYIGGANVSDMATTNVSRYDFALDSWTMMAPLPSATCGEGAVIGPDGLVYVFGGADSPWNTGMGEVYAGTYTYDLESNTWATVDDMNVARAWLGAAVSDNKILAIGGNSMSAGYALVESLDTLQNQLANLQKQVTVLQNQLTQANNDIAALDGDVSDLTAENALLKQQLVNLSAELNQTTDDLNAALNAANNNANNAKSAADSANMIGMIGIIIGIVAIIIAVIAMVMKKKAPIQQMQPQPPMPPQ